MSDSQFRFDQGCRTLRYLLLSDWRSNRPSARIMRSLLDLERRLKKTARRDYIDQRQFLASETAPVSSIDTMLRRLTAIRRGR
jgi:hypothetical protein